MSSRSNAFAPELAVAVIRAPRLSCLTLTPLPIPAQPHGNPGRRPRAQLRTRLLLRPKALTRVPSPGQDGSPIRDNRENGSTLLFGFPETQEDYTSANMSTTAFCPGRRELGTFPREHHKNRYVLRLRESQPARQAKVEEERPCWLAVRPSRLRILDRPRRLAETKARRIAVVERKMQQQRHQPQNDTETMRQSEIFTNSVIKELLARRAHVGVSFD